METGTKYKESGAFSPLILLGVPLFILINLILALVYSYVDVYVPIVGYLSIIFVGAYIVTNTVCSCYLLKLFKVRNRSITLIWAVFTVVVAIYMNWGTFVYVLINKMVEAEEGVNLITLLTNPEGLWQTVKAIAETGWYSLSSSDVKGVVLWAFWGIEALAITYFLIKAPFSVLNEVFCETCSKWTNVTESAFSFKTANRLKLQSQFSSGILEFTQHCTAPTNSDAHYYNIDASICDTCSELVALTLNAIKVEVDEKGNVSLNKDPLAENIIYTVEDFNQLTLQLQAIA